MLTAQENFNSLPVPQTDWYSAALPSLPESNGNALRSYQLEALIGIVNAWRRNVKRQLLVLPTGAGKTTVFSQLPYLLEAMGLPEKLLVVAHRTELLEQAIQTLTRYNPGKIIALEQASDQATPDADIIVASIDTLMARDSRRLRNLPLDQIGALVIDEAHRSAALTYRKLINQFSEQSPGLILGVTATPKRGDRVGLDNVFAEIVYHRHLEDLIESGHICPITGWQIHTETVLEGVHVRCGDFVVGELANRVNTPSRNALVAQTYAKTIAGHPALVFCANIKHAEDMAETFRTAGFACEAVHGKLSPEDRNQRIAAFRERKLTVLTNVQILTEGFDEPSIRGIFVARPTRSHLFYMQMVGRGFRPDPESGKPGLHVFDFTDGLGQHARHLVGLPTLFGLPLRCDFKGKNALKISKEIKRIAHLMAERRDEPAEMTIARAVEMVHRRKAAAQGPETSATAEETVRFLISEMEEVMRLEAGRHPKPEPQPRTTPQPTKPLPPRPDPPLQVVPPGPPDKTEPLHGPDKKVFSTDQRNLWRKEPATERQLHALGRLGVAIPISLTKPFFNKHHANLCFELSHAEALEIPVRCTFCDNPLQTLDSSDPKYLEFVGGEPDPLYVCGTCIVKDLSREPEQKLLSTTAVRTQPTPATKRAIEMLLAQTDGLLGCEQLCDVLRGYRVVVFDATGRKTCSLAELGNRVKLTVQLQRIRSRAEEESLFALVFEAVAQLEMEKKVIIQKNGSIALKRQSENWASAMQTSLNLVEGLKRKEGIG